MRDPELRHDPIKILYIGGYSRSGTTLLLRLLGELPGMVAVGELFDVWDRSYRQNQLCGCGTAFHECDFWREVTLKAFGCEPADLPADDYEPDEQTGPGNGVGPSTVATGSTIGDVPGPASIVRERLGGALRLHRGRLGGSLHRRLFEGAPSSVGPARGPRGGAPCRASGARQQGGRLLVASAQGAARDPLEGATDGPSHSAPIFARMGRA